MTDEMPRAVSFLMIVVATCSGNCQANTIDKLRNDLTQPTGCTVEISGLWATTNVAGQPSEIRITDGKVSRGASKLIHGTLNVPIQPGQVVRVAAVSSKFDPKNDLLTVGIQTAGIIVPVTFVFERGSLEAASGGGIISIVEGVLKPSRPVVAATLPPPAPRTSTSQPAPAPQSGPPTILEQYTPTPSAAASSSASQPQFPFTIEGIGLRMTLAQVREEAKKAGSIKGPVKQGPTTYNLDTKDLGFQVEFDKNGKVNQYNVSAKNPRHIRETEHSGPLHDMLLKAFGPESAWAGQVNYDLGEGGGAYAIVSDRSMLSNN